MMKALSHIKLLNEFYSRKLNEKHKFCFLFSDFFPFPSAPDFPQEIPFIPPVPGIKISKEYLGKTVQEWKMAQPSSGSGLPAIRDLIHPTLTEPLKQHQQSTFRMVKTGRIRKDIHVFCNFLHFTSICMFKWHVVEEYSCMIFQ